MSADLIANKIKELWSKNLVKFSGIGEAPDFFIPLYVYKDGYKEIVNVVYDEMIGIILEVKED